MSDTLNIDSILQASKIGGSRLTRLAVLDDVGSTNDWCLEKCREGLILPFACVTDNQTGGRGRRGHRWYSSPGASITMSLAWGFDGRADQIGIFSLAMGMAVTDVLRAHGIQHVMLKWPNDVIVNHQKIAGILVETIKIDGQFNVVIGVGLNYDIGSIVLEQIEGDAEKLLWTDYCQSSGHEARADRNLLTGELLEECLNMCERYKRDYDSLSVEFDSRYNAYIRTPVNVKLSDGKVIEGISLGTTKQGELRVLVDDKEQVFNSAEISLRKAVEC